MNTVYPTNLQNPVIVPLTAQNASEQPATTAARIMPTGSVNNVFNNLAALSNRFTNGII